MKSRKRWLFDPCRAGHRAAGPLPTGNEGHFYKGKAEWDAARSGA